MNWLRKIFAKGEIKKDAPAKSESIREVTIHLALRRPKTNVQPTLDQIKVTGSAKRTFDQNGAPETTFTMYRYADPLTMVELQAAVYWNDCIDSLVLEMSEARDWLKAADSITGTPYFVGLSETGDVKKDVLIQCLATISTHYAILERKTLPYGAVISNWLDSIKGDENQVDRLTDVARSEKLAKPLNADLFAPGLVNHLQKSVS